MTIQLRQHSVQQQCFIQCLKYNEITGAACSLIICVFILILLVVDLEVAQLVRVFRRGDHTQPVTQVVLLHVLLRQVLQVPSTGRVHI